MCWSPIRVDGEIVVLSIDPRAMRLLVHHTVIITGVIVGIMLAATSCGCPCCYYVEGEDEC